MIFTRCKSADADDPVLCADCGSADFVHHRTEPYNHHRPIAHIMDAVKKIQNEDYDITLDVHTGDEIEILADNLKHYGPPHRRAGQPKPEGQPGYKEMQIAPAAAPDQAALFI